MTLYSLEDRSERIPESGCSIWLGQITNAGYGLLPWNKSPRLAHRHAWTEKYGPITPKQMVLHRCNIKTCINPDHLYIGGHRENAFDAIKVGKWPDNKGSRHGRSKLNEEQVMEIRALYKTGSYSQDVLAKEFGVGQMAISRIVTRYYWRHI